MERTNIAEILQNVPEGADIRLYSPLFGECRLENPVKDSRITVRSQGGTIYTFHGDGTYIEGVGECLLFPTSEKTWEDWQRKLFREGFFITNGETGYTYLYRGDGSVQDCYNRTFTINQTERYRFADKDEIVRFLKKVYDNGYKYIVKEKRIGAFPSSFHKAADTERLRITVGRNETHEYRLTSCQYDAVKTLLDFITKI